MVEALTVPAAAPAETRPLNEMDRRFIEQAQLHARALATKETPILGPPPLLPRKCDYSRFVTLVRNQDGAGGCGGMATLAVAEILKEMEKPYAPNLSYRFANYVYNQSSIHHQDPRITQHGLNQATSLIHYGCCVETTWPTNFDPPVTIFPDDEAPPEDAFREAQLYRMASWSENFAFYSAEQIRMLLAAKGPLIAQNPNHVFVILSYDDDTSMFTLLNSWGDRWGQNGMIEVPYDRINNPFGANHDFDVNTLAFLVNYPAPPEAHPYTGRIRVRHLQSRRYLTIKVGSPGGVVTTVWDRPNRSAMVDDSRNLTYTFPLPRVRMSWPPSPRRQWYVEVTDDSPGSQEEAAAFVEEVVLVKRDPAPELYRPEAGEIPIKHGETVRIHIPARTFSFPKLEEWLKWARRLIGLPG